MSLAEEHKQLKVYLPEIVGKTFYARCEMERRYLQNDTLAHHANIYFACLTTTLSILSLFTNTPLVPFLSLISAAILTLAIVYATSRDYKTKAIEARLCYNELQNLWFHIDHLLDTEPSDLNDQMLSAADDYSAILKRYENHLPKDRDKALRQTNASPFKKGFEYYAIRLAVYLGPIVLLGVLTLLFCCMKAIA